MAYQLTPEDLEIGKEYVIEIHHGFSNNETHDIMESIIRYNGTYTYIKSSSYNISKSVLLYEFINTGYRLQLLYNSNSKKFYGHFNEIDDFMYCGIFEQPTNEYVLK